MRHTFSIALRALSLFSFLAILPCRAESSFVVSGTSAASERAGGGGDSYAPILSADGRYLLFASTANDLVLWNGQGTMPASFPPHINVFLRDRTEGKTALVSWNLSATAGGNGDSMPRSISDNGQYVLFESTASDLAAGDTNRTSDIFLRDMVKGVTYLVSASLGGGTGNGASHSAVMTPDGRFVAFVSAASDLVSNDTNWISDVFVRDLQSSITALVSVGAAPTPLIRRTSSSEAPVITPDGRFIAFYSTATNLVSGVTTTSEVYVRDLQLHITHWASINARTQLQAVLGAASSLSYNHAIGTDGRYVVYQSSSDPSDRGDPANPWQGLILRHDLETGATELVHTNAAVSRFDHLEYRSLDITPDARFIAFVANADDGGTDSTSLLLWDSEKKNAGLVSESSAGAVPPGSVSAWPALSEDGQVVAFLSNAHDPLKEVPGLYVHHVQAGETHRINLGTDSMGEAADFWVAPQLSADGRSVAFESTGETLVPIDGNRSFDVFVRDLEAGVTALESVREMSLEATTAHGPSSMAARSISRDGRHLVFSSEAVDLVSIPDRNRSRDIFVRDLLTGNIVPVSLATNGVHFGSGVSSEASITADGRYVTFTSGADDLVDGDTNRFRDVFLRDLISGTTELISASTNGLTSGSQASYAPTISEDGRFVLFRSQARDLDAVLLASGIDENLFLLDRQFQTATGQTVARGSAAGAAMTPDGRFIAVADSATPGFLLWDTTDGRIILTNSLPRTPMFLAISPDGNRIAYSGSFLPLQVLDRSSGRTWSIAPAATVFHFSNDGKYLVSENRVRDLVDQIFVHDLEADTRLLVSRSYLADQPGNAASGSPVISPNGRFIAYRSRASDLVPGDTNGHSDVFLYDRLSETTILLSANRMGDSSGSSGSWAPHFSPDGGTLFFQSWATDLADGDFNQTGDLFGFRISSAGMADSDEDGLDDEWELQFFENLTRDGGADFDEDGASDAFEFFAGTNPVDADSIFRGQILWEADGVEIRWPAARGRAYRVEFKESLSEGGWQALKGVTVVGGSGSAHDAAVTDARRFYRIVSF